VGAALHEADLAIATHRVAHVVAVVPGIVHPDHFEHERFGLGSLESTESSELVADDAGLESELLRVLDMLELAAATEAEVAAGRIDTVFRGAEDEDGGSLDHVGLIVGDFGDDALAGDAVFDEDDTAILGVADRTAAGGESSEFEFDGYEGAVVETAVFATSLPGYGLGDDGGGESRLFGGGHKSIVLVRGWSHQRSRQWGGSIA
jgi:hypothetical protein